MKWLLRIWVEKWLKRAILAGLAWVAGHNLERFGITVNPQAASVAIWAALDAARNYAKVQWGLKWL